MTRIRFLRPLLLLAALGLFHLSGCRRPEEEDSYPLWFLAVTVMEFTEDGNTRAVDGCPQLHWHYAPDLSGDNVQSCQDGSNYVRAYEHIDQIVTVNYQVKCDGYFDSESLSVTFDPDSATQRPGRGGPEVFHSERITLLRQ